MLAPNPSYPIHAFGFLMAGGVVRSVPAEPTPASFVALERAIQHSIPKPIAVVACYPSNPTAMVAALDFYTGHSANSAITASATTSSPPSRRIGQTS